VTDRMRARRRRAHARSRPSALPHTGKAGWAVAVLASLLLVVGGAVGYWLGLGAGAPPPDPAGGTRPAALSASPRPSPRVAGTGPSAGSRRPERPRPTPARPRPGRVPALPDTAPPGSPPRARVAIIFDDAGGQLAQLDPILALGRPVTVAVLPGLPASRAVAERARAAGLEVLLHLPLEAEDPARRLGPHGITTAMSEDAVVREVESALASVPGAVGINGHMGSRATADPRVMRAVLRVARSRGLFFVDSRTTPASVAVPLARAAGVPTAERTVFLDNAEDPEAIAAQVRRLLEVALARGEAVGIGHVQRVTADVVRALLPAFDAAGVALVPVSWLVR